jgi:hypothetical protein
MINALERLEILKQKRLDKLSGKLQLIPFYHHLPKLSKFLPGIFKGSKTTCMAGTGDGKSKFTRFCTILIPYWLKQKENLDYKIIYFSLEESKEEFIDSMFLMLLKVNYGIELDYFKLNSYGQETLDEDVLVKVGLCAAEVDKILEDVIVVDNVYNPTGKTPL